MLITMKNKFQKLLLLFFPLLLLGDTLNGQEATGAGTGNPNFYSDLLAITLMVVAGVVLLSALASLVQVLNVMVQVKKIELYKAKGLELEEEKPRVPKESLWDQFYKRLTKVVPVEKEKDILFEHEYDGIRELDNSLPPWWVYMFYITIVFAVVYMTYYHFTDAGLSQEEQYAQEMQEAEEAVKAHLALQGSNIDETSVQMVANENELALGKTMYETNCAACHGMMGEGGVGPNLTDEYWIHGGSIQDVFKTIKYGVPEKGMIAWQAQLRPKDMQRVSSYIMTMQGTSPPNAKEPQGEKVQVDDAEEGGSPVQDTSSQAQVIGMK